MNDPGSATSGEGRDQAHALATVEAVRAAGGTADANFDSVTAFDAAEGMVGAGARAVTGGSTSS